MLKINEKINWFHFLTRPLTIFESSLASHATSSLYAYKVFGIKFTESLFVEHESENNVVYYFRMKEKHDKLLLNAKRLSENNELVKRNLLKALEINEATIKILKKGYRHFDNLADIIEHITQLLFYCNVFPYFVSDDNNDIFIRDTVIKLRQITYNPPFFENILTPFLINYLYKNDNSKAKEFIELMTLNELMENNFQKAKDRLVKRSLNKKFIYQIIGKKEKIIWVDDTKPILNKLLNIKIGDDKNLKELKGAIAYTGIVRGRALVVLNYHKNYTIPSESPIILVSSDGNPNFVLDIKKMIGLITDEGGSLCHAAVIAREYKMPCIVGTSKATKVIKTGDYIELDANQGIVRILKTIPSGK